MPAKGWRKPSHLRKTPERRANQLPPELDNPQPDAPEIGLFSEEHTYGYWSLTLAKRGDHIPDYWYDRARIYATEYAKEAIVSLEAGGKQQRHHVQGCLGLHAEQTQEGAKKLLAHFKDFIPVQRGSGAAVVLKPCSAGQTFELMLGYCMKDEGKPHFRKHLVGVTEEQASAARRAHQAVHIDPTAGRRMLTKTNIMREMFSFHWLWLRPLRCTAERTLQASDTPVN